MSEREKLRLIFPEKGIQNKTLSRDATVDLYADGGIYLHLPLANVGLSPTEVRELVSTLTGLEVER